MAEKFSEISLIVPFSSDYILPQYHFTIINFIWASFMSQLTSIVIKRRKVRSKIRKYPVHVIVIQKPAQIRYKKTAQLYYIYLYGREYSDDYKSPAYFRTNILYLYKHEYRISVYQPHCKHNHKSLPHVTPPCRTTIHTKIHPYSLIHKIPPRKPAI